MEPHYSDEAVTLYHGDCIDVLRKLPNCSVDSVVTDPPYGLEFMGKEWDAFRLDDPGTPRPPQCWPSANGRANGQPSACASSNPAGTCSPSVAPAPGTGSRSLSRTPGLRSATASRGCTGQGFLSRWTCRRRLTRSTVTKPNAEVPWRWDEDTVSWVEVSAPSPSWMYDLESDAWIPPVEYPQDGGHYTWDEETLSWVDLTPAE